MQCAEGRRKTQSGAEYNYEGIVPRTAFEGSYNAESLIYAHAPLAVHTTAMVSYSYAFYGRLSMKRSQHVVKKTFFTALFLLLSVSILVLFTACVQGADAGVNKVDTIAVTGITLNKTTLELTVGATEKLIATVLPENATNKKVTWSSSNEVIAIVNEDGTITAKAAGEVVITVKTDDGSHTASCTVKVKATVEQLIHKAVDNVLAKTKLTNAGLPYIDPNTQSTEEIEKYLSPLGLARKDDSPDSKLVLFSKVNNLAVDPNYKKSGKTTYIWDRATILEGADLVREGYATLLHGVKDDSIKLPDPDPYEFNSVSDVLYWKWQNFKSDIPYFFTTTSYSWLCDWDAYIYSSGGFDVKGLYRVYSTTIPSTLMFAVKPIGISASIEPQLYFLDSSSGLAIIDLELTFIKREDRSNMYTFYGKSYYVKDDNPIPPVDDDEVDGKYNERAKVFHMLKSSTLVRLALEENLKKSLETPEIIDLLKAKHNISEGEARNIIASEIKGTVKKYLNNFPPFADNFKNLNDWDIYISFGRYYSAQGYFPNEIWRNTYKVTGQDAKDFWKTCWE